MTFIRDFFRWRRVRRHVARHGWVFDFHGVAVRLPLMDSPGCANALLRGTYESEEAAFIAGHLPVDRPVIELGGSLGIVSALIGSRLEAGVPHLIVEANPALVEACAENAGIARRPAAELRQAAVFYDGPVARFSAGGHVHANRLAKQGDDAGVIEVGAVTLESLWRGIGAPEGFTLVCDIEGGEAAMIHAEAEVLAHAGVVIMELHPGNYAAGHETEATLIAAMATAGLVLRERVADVGLWTRGQAA